VNEQWFVSGCPADRHANGQIVVRLADLPVLPVTMVQSFAVNGRHQAASLDPVSGESKRTFFRQQNYLSEEGWRVSIEP